MLLGGEQARMVFTDAPYNVKITGNVTGSDRHGEFVMASGEMTDEEFTAFLAKSLQQVAASLMSGGLCYFCMDWRHVGHVLDAYKATELEFLNLICWDKGQGSLGSFYRSRHELVFLFRNPGAAHRNRVELGRHGRDRHNVWCYPGVNGFGADKAREREMHPTVKPLALVRDAILDASSRGELVLDLFSGSGTTIVAAHDAKRRGAAIDLDPRYVDTAVMRWQDFAGAEARLAATGQTFREVRAERMAGADVVQLPPARTRARASA